MNICSPSLVCYIVVSPAVICASLRGSTPKKSRLVSITGYPSESMVEVSTKQAMVPEEEHRVPKTVRVAGRLTIIIMQRRIGKSPRYGRISRAGNISSSGLSSSYYYSVLSTEYPFLDTNTTNPLSSGTPESPGTGTERYGIVPVKIKDTDRNW